jgi:hypothetical protein
LCCAVAVLQISGIWLQLAYLLERFSFLVSWSWCEVPRRPCLLLCELILWPPVQCPANKKLKSILSVFILQKKPTAQNFVTWYKMLYVRRYASVTTLCLCRCCHTRYEWKWCAMTWTGFGSCEYDSLSNISKSLSALVEFQISAVVSQFRRLAVRKFNFVSPSVL